MVLIILGSKRILLAETAMDNAGLLMPREMVLVTIKPGFGSTGLGVNTHFVVEVKPPVGAALPIARTVPAGLNANQWYEVY